jgi:hypothetical protein
MRRFEALAIVGFVAMGLGVVVACGGALAPAEPSPPIERATPDDDAAGGGETSGPHGPLPGAGDAGGADGDGDAGARSGIPNDVNNCGASGAVCGISNAVAKCAGATCAIDSCLADFVDCDGDPTNGCECPSDSCAADMPGKGNCGKRVFVTSTVTTGNVGGLAGADAKCQAAASSAVRPGVYKAWLSDAVASPATRFTRAAIPYRLVNGILIAKNWSDLVDGTLANPINLDERGGPAPTTNGLCGEAVISPWTWTTNAGNAWGVLAENCGNWTDDSGPNSSEWGNGSSVTDWSFSCNGGSCKKLAPLFCFQQ